MKKEPIRVLHVLQRMEAAGVQTLLMSIYRNIDRKKVQFDFLVHYNTPQLFDEEVKKMGGKIYRLTFREDYNVFKYCRDLDNFFKKHNEYKIIHAHMHSLGFIYLHYAKKYNIPVRIAHSHTNCTQNDMKKVLKLIMNKLYAKNATELFACSEVAGKYMFGDKPFRIINNAIDSEKFAFDKKKRETKRKELGLENNFIIGNVGRFEIQKNQKFSIKVFEECLKIDNSARLILIGTGSMYEEIQKIIKAKNLGDKILLLGNRKDIAELYQAMDVFLFPSLFEGLGIVGIEAQAAGTPTVCTDTLPKEINVTPLLHRVSLNITAKEWAEEVVRASKDNLAHKNTTQYLKEANYDIYSLVNSLEQFYLEQYKGCVSNE